MYLNDLEFLPRVPVSRMRKPNPFFALKRANAISSGLSGLGMASRSSPPSDVADEGVVFDNGDGTQSMWVQGNVGGNFKWVFLTIPKTYKGLPVWFEGDRSVAAAAASNSRDHTSYTLVESYDFDDTLYLEDLGIAQEMSNSPPSITAGQYYKHVPAGYRPDLWLGRHRWERFLDWAVPLATFIGAGLVIGGVVAGAGGTGGGAAGATTAAPAAAPAATTAGAAGGGAASGITAGQVASAALTVASAAAKKQQADKQAEQQQRQIDAQNAEAERIKQQTVDIQKQTAAVQAATPKPFVPSPVSSTAPSTYNQAPPAAPFDIKKLILPAAAALAAMILMGH